MTRPDRAREEHEVAEDLEQLRTAVRAFSEEREWARFHTPKNLVMALAGEVGELVAELQWLERDEIDTALAPGTDLRERFEAEVADVLIYLVRLADVCDLDLLAVAGRKLALNASRYPAEAARGRAEKYTRLGSAQSQP